MGDIIDLDHPIFVTMRELKAGVFSELSVQRENLNDI